MACPAPFNMLQGGLAEIELQSGQCVWSDLLEIVEVNKLAGSTEFRAVSDIVISDEAAEIHKAAHEKNGEQAYGIHGCEPLQ